MRTTITLDADVDALVQKAIKQRGSSMKEIVNQSLRAALGGQDDAAPFHTPVFAMGAPRVPLDKALQLADDLEDAELRRKLEHRR